MADGITTHSMMTTMDKEMTSYPPPGIEPMSRSDISLISDELRKTIDLIIQLVLSNIIAAAGVVCNIINILVYWRIGFKESITVSLFALSISDLAILIVKIWSVLCQVPSLLQLSDTASFLRELSLITGVLKITLTRISIWITVLITMERCACIGLPLKVKRIFTPRRTVLVIASCAVLIFLSTIPIYMSVYIGYRPVHGTNRTRLGVLRTTSAESLRGMSISINLFIQFFSLVVIIVSNGLLLAALRREKRNLTAQNTNSFKMISPLSGSDQTAEREAPGSSQEDRQGPVPGSSSQSVSTSTISWHVQDNAEVGEPSETHHPIAQSKTSQHSLAPPNPKHKSSAKLKGRDHSITAWTETHTTLENPKSGGETCQIIPELKKQRLGSLPACGPNAVALMSQQRNWRVGKMVAMLSLVLLISYIPGTVQLIISLIEPEFGSAGRYRRIFAVSWTFVTLLETFNASINIAVYYKMSTLYRTTVRKMLCRGGNRVGDGSLAVSTPRPNP
ncbi:chemosensory receptor b [Plakobranchus ocellatus]|uniref:Chemosensory receptor b n=1 Tax=Plakobranchus ocellatus TaxID=259542 RepID=A0AAV4AZK8_9GAST|nr:chemosensory receptor b [Plakobranchus ocellatus]